MPPGANPGVRTPDEDFDLDLTNTDYERLATSAKRIGELLTRTTDANLVGCLDDLLGATYALTFAKHGDFTDRTGKPIEVPVVQNRANQLAQGHVRVTGKWMAGLHFNSALFRTSAVYHRALKVIIGPGKIDHLRKEAEKRYKTKTGSDWQNTNIQQVHDQVNYLKHDAPGTYHSRQVTYEQALQALHELLDLIEKTTP